MDSQQRAYVFENGSRWLDQKILQELGFDTSRGPSDPGASEFYRRQRTRRGFVALENDGPAWRKWIEDLDRQAHERKAQGWPAYGRTEIERESSTRLVGVRHDRGVPLHEQEAAPVIGTADQSCIHSRTTLWLASCSTILESQSPWPAFMAYFRVADDISEADIKVLRRQGRYPAEWVTSGLPVIRDLSALWHREPSIII